MSRSQLLHSCFEGKASWLEQTCAPLATQWVHRRWSWKSTKLGAQVSVGESHATASARWASSFGATVSRTFELRQKHCRSKFFSRIVTFGRNTLPIKWDTPCGIKTKQWNKRFTWHTDNNARCGRAVKTKRKKRTTYMVRINTIAYSVVKQRIELKGLCISYAGCSLCGILRMHLPTSVQAAVGFSLY